MSRRSILVVLAIATLALGTPHAARSDDPAITLTINGHRFEPQELAIPAGKKVTLAVKNLNATPSEFESTDLNREKVVVGGSTITLFIGPLRPGSYEFFDDLNTDTPHGHIIAK